MGIIQLKNINKYYGKEIKTHVLKSVDLTIEEGSFVSIIGEGGSGKSTLLNLIGTLDKPSDGDVVINGVNTENMTPNDLAKLRNKDIGFIFQFHHLLPEFTVMENILMPYNLSHKKVTPEILKRANELIDIVGLTEVSNNKSTNISGGQQQRAAIARALINNPKIILADEPTGNLDSKTTNDVYELLRKVNKLYNTTFLIITHDSRIADKTDRVLEINDGEIVRDFLN